MTEGQFVGSQIDNIEDPAVRRRAVVAALAAIDGEVSANPRQPAAAKGSTARR